MQLNKMIRAIKAIKMPVIKSNAHWIPWISIILFITAQFVMKININYVLCQKNSRLFGYMQVHPMSPDRRCAKKCCMRDASRKNFNTQKFGLLTFPKLDSQAYDARRTMLHKCILGRWKSPFVLYGITVPSLCRRFNMPVHWQFFNFLREPS